MKKLILLFFGLLILAGCQFDFVIPTIPTDDTQQTESQPVEKKNLSTPINTIDENGLATFEVENAISYIFILNDGDSVETISCTLQLADGDKLKVMAVADPNSSFTNSDWSYVVTCSITNVPDDSIEFPWI